MTTLGADIEMIAYNNGVPKSVVGMIGGSKEAPVFVDKGNLQEDNVLAEFAIDPVQTEQEWLDSILSVQDQMKLRLGQLELRNMPSVDFPLEELQTQQAQEFGCQPDYNAWSMSMNPAPDPARVGGLRTCGGHIHVGDTFEDEYEKAMFIQWMDVYLGLPSVLFDNDNRRRRVYGKAGAFRDKPYGVEYRTLSNFWTKDSRMIQWVYRQTLAALNRHRQQDLFDLISEYQAGDIQEAINIGNSELAQELLTDLEVEW